MNFYRCLLQVIFISEELIVITYYTKINNYTINMRQILLGKDMDIAHFGEFNAVSCITAFDEILHPSKAAGLHKLTGKQRLPSGKTDCGR